MGKAKKTVLQGVTEAHYIESLGNYADAEAKERTITSKIDVEVNKIKQKYADELQRLADKKQAHFEVVMTYCSENKDMLFSKKRSMETPHGVVGFRFGTPKLKTLKGFTWAAVLEVAKKLMPDYVRTVNEPAKDRLLADADKPEVAELLPQIGVYVDNDETFYIKTPETKAAEIV